jgi:hypothetical protein
MRKKKSSRRKKKEARSGGFQEKKERKKERKKSIYKWKRNYVMRPRTFFFGQKLVIVFLAFF